MSGQKSDQGKPDDGNAAYFADVMRRKTRSPVRRVQFWLDRRVADVLKLLYLPVARRWRTRGRRLLTVSNPTRIGHLAAEPDWYLKKIALGDFPARPATLLMRKSANPALVDVWRRHLDVVAGGLRYRLLQPLLAFPDLVLDLGQCIARLDGAAEYAEVQARWRRRAPIVTLPPEIERRGRETLARMGVPASGWFVCFHAREGGYAPKDEFVHAHRNSDVEALAPALDEIVARGGWCVRMGDATMTPLAPRRGVVDYALSPEKSAAMDVFLCARTRFFLGNTSGLSVLSGAFGVRSALVNMIPHAASLGIGADDLVIPKLLARDDDTLVGFPEIFAGEVATYRAAELFTRAGLTPLENTPEDILALVCQMLDELESGDTKRDPDDAYRQLLAPNHYSYHSASRVGRAFLEKHRDLLATGDRDNRTGSL